MSTQVDIGIRPDNNAKYGGFEKPSKETYNVNHGRVASAPTVGGSDIHEKRSPRGKPAGAPASRHVDAEFLG